MRFAALLASLALVTAACGGGSQQRKKDPRKDRMESADDLLDEKVDVERQPRRAAAGRTMAEMPAPPEEPARSIDGRNDDWETRYRRFDDKKYVETGHEFWKGSSDAAFRAAVEADEGFLYFIVEVKDDRVLASEAGADPTDGIVIWLRDPGLDLLVKSLPSSLGLDRYVEAETAILFEPDGTIRPYGQHDVPMEKDYMFATMDKRKNGYVLEVALKVELFRQVSALPLPQVAFRIELLDGDEEDRPGHQTVMSTLPDRGTDTPRMAIFDAGGLLPHEEVGNAPPRANAMGQWELSEGEWTFTAFEVVPRYWVTLDEEKSFRQALQKSEVLGDLCRVASKDIHLVEAYQSRRGGFRSGLVLCGARAISGRCPSDAESRLYWVALKPDGEEWMVDDYIEVFEKPLKQCTYEARKGEPFYRDFSLFPLDLMSPAVWAVGWTKDHDEGSRYEHINGVTILNTEHPDGPIGTVWTELERADTEERTRSSSRVYFTYVNDDDNLDICSIESLNEQSCTGLDRGCRTYENGEMVLTNIQMWNPKKGAFERYELSKHRNCTSRFDFSDREGYLLLQVKGRIGLLPSPESNEQEEESLDLF